MNALWNILFKLAFVFSFEAYVPSKTSALEIIHNILYNCLLLPDEQNPEICGEITSIGEKAVKIVWKTPKWW